MLMKTASGVKERRRASWHLPRNVRRQRPSPQTARRVTSISCSKRWKTGVELKGTEVKSLRAGGVNLKDSWVDIEDGELLVKGMHITPYDHGNIFNQDPLRMRRLLAHKTEIRRLHQQCKLQGYTLVPLSLYFKHGRVKMEVGLCKGKKLYDKRADAAKRDAKRSIDRAVKSNGKFC